MNSLNINKDTDTFLVRGICAAIQNMAMPSFDNLQTILNKFGFKIVKI